MESDETKPHSAEYFGEQRDFWWNRDFLELMARRWRMHEVRSILDVGCGVGHWGRLLLLLVSKEAKLSGIDREWEWIEAATSRATEAGFGSRCHYCFGDAEKIPYDDDTFEMVTCQTVLIHVPDVTGVIREMLRVLKPGGLLAVAFYGSMHPNGLPSCAGEKKLGTGKRGIPF